jgi:hypothetical protein
VTQHTVRLGGNYKLQSSDQQMVVRALSAGYVQSAYHISPANTASAACVCCCTCSQSLPCAWRLPSPLQVCCWDDDVLSDTASQKLTHTKPDAQVDITSRASAASTTTEQAMAQALAIAGRATTSDQAEEFHLSPRSGFSGLSSLLGVRSPRLTGSTPAQIRTV